MKLFYLTIVIILFSSCKQNTPTTVEKSLDIQEELASIEVTRTGFMRAINEKNYQDLGNWSTQDLIQVLPNDNDWNNMFIIRGAMGKFPYDSIRMHPKETVVVNDSLAYDFGVSHVYYTDSIGEVHRLRDTYLAILKKGAEGRWRLHREVASSRILEDN